MSSIRNRPKALIIQRGARRRYAIPKLLNELGFLEQFVTDSHSDSLLGRLGGLIARFRQPPESLRRLLERSPRAQGVPLERVTSLDIWTWYERRLGPLRERDVVRWLAKREEIWHSLLKTRARLEKCNVVYSMNGENQKLLRDARARGCKSAVDVFISPFNLRETFEEKTMLGISPTNWERHHEATENHYRVTYRLADKLLCPSEWVADAVVRLDPQLESKIVVSPYGSSLSICAAGRRPRKGRIFWAGGDWCRKGLHYLAGAADIIKGENPDYEFRAAGITDPQVTTMPRFRNINFLGKLKRAEMEEEFRTADLFVFPTLSEGMAGVAIEAISAGCPVVTTRAAGVDAIENGRSGVILESKDPSRIAREIVALCEDREKLAAMSRQTILLAANYSEEAWKKRLEQILVDLVE